MSIPNASQTDVLMQKARYGQSAGGHMHTYIIHTHTHTHTCIHIYIIDELCNRPVLPLVQVGIMVADVTVVNLLVAAPAFLVRTFSAR